MPSSKSSSKDMTLLTRVRMSSMARLPQTIIGDGLPLRLKEKILRKLLPCMKKVVNRHKFSMNKRSIQKILLSRTQITETDMSKILPLKTSKMSKSKPKMLRRKPGACLPGALQK